MFTWICPQCGREVLPSYDQCPSCAQKGKEAGTSSAAGPAPPHSDVAAAPPPAPPQAAPQQPQGYQQPPPGYQPPPPGYQQAPVYQQPVRMIPRPSSGLPTWLLTVLFAFAFLGLVLGINWGIGYLRNPSQAASPPAQVESPAAKSVAKTSALQKYVEISGIRWGQDAKKKIIVKFTVTNHSNADLSGLAGNVTVWGRTQKSEEDAAGTFSFTANVGPQAAQEVSAPLNTKLKIYELPDWQNVNADLQITSPQ
jgi:hypothetical protein